MFQPGNWVTVGSLIFFRAVPDTSAGCGRSLAGTLIENNPLALKAHPGRTTDRAGGPPVACCDAEQPV